MTYARRGYCAAFDGEYLGDFTALGEAFAACDRAAEARAGVAPASPAESLWLPIVRGLFGALLIAA